MTARSAFYAGSFRLAIQSVVTSLLAVCGLSAALPASAQLIDSNYMTGAKRAPDGDDTGIELNYPTTFYGKTYSSIFLSTNGYLSYENSSDPTSQTFPTTVLPVIAPLWDNWTTEQTEAPGTSLFYRLGPDRLEATWTVQRHDPFDPNFNPISQFQAVVYNDGLIGFGYGSIDLNGNTVRGVNKGDGIASTDGSTVNEARSNTQRFYRFDSTTGRYNIVAAPVPESGLIAAFVFGSIGIGLLTRRKVR